MNRLLQGDVGSGKTVIAFLAAIAAAESGGQAALMAPTELLAEQHARTLASLAEAVELGFNDFKLLKTDKDLDPLRKAGGFDKFVAQQEAVGAKKADEAIGKEMANNKTFPFDFTLPNLDGKPVSLTVTEFLLLEALAHRPGVIKSRNQLMDAAYPDDVFVDDRTVDSHIKRMRRKFRQVDSSFGAIETLYGAGYSFSDG